MFQGSERRLRDSRVLVIGCGALGNEVLKNLVLMGVGHLVIVDFDFVEASNLTRSVLFRKEDVGMRKTDSARRSLLGINPDLNIRSIFGDVAYDVGLGIFREADAVVGCVDSRWARYCIQRLCLRVGKPWVDGGILELEGTVRVFAPGRSCYACSLGPMGLDELKRRVPCSGLIRRAESAGHALTTPISASVIGAVQAQEAVKLILGTAGDDMGRMFYYDGGQFSARTVLFDAWDEDCELHGDLYGPLADAPSGITSSTRLEELSGYGVLLLDDPFVDFIVNSSTGERTDVMLPARAVRSHIENDPVLRTFPTGVFRSHEWNEIPADFPYGNLSLKDIGIPSSDILKFRTVENYLYIAMDYEN